MREEGREGESDGNCVCHLLQVEVEVHGAGSQTGYQGLCLELLSMFTLMRKWEGPPPLSLSLSLSLSLCQVL